MFLRRYVRTKAGKQHTYFALVESVRTEAGPRQHLVAYPSELNADQVLAAAKSAAQGIAGVIGAE